MPSTRSSMLTVRKSMLKRARAVVLGTVECSCAAENTSTPPGRRHDPHVGLQLQRLGRLGLLASFLRHLLRSLLSAGAVPLLVVVSGGAVLHRLIEELGVEGHRVLGLDRVHGQPPVELLVRRREPGVAMGMELVRQARVQVAGRRHRSQARNVEVGLLEVAADFREQPADQHLRGLVVDEARLELREDLHVFLRGEGLVCERRFVRGERFDAQLPGELDQPARAGAGGVGEQIAAVEQVPPIGVLETGIDVVRGHGLVLLG